MKSLPSDEAYTSQFHTKLVRKVFNRNIDIDPCADSTNRLNARVFFTEKTNGLTQDWFFPELENPCCFVNPPYSKGFQKAFLTKLIEQLEKRYIKEAITLTLDGVLHNRSTSVLIANHCQSVAMAGRIKFVDALGHPKGASNPRDHVFCYFGKNSDRFKEVFGLYYPIYQPVL